MKPKTAAILRHIIDTIFLIMLASFILLKIAQIFYEKDFAWIAQLDYSHMVIAFVLFSALVGWFAPKKVLASFRSIKLFPGHCGLVAKVFFVCLLSIVLAYWITLLKIETSQLSALLIIVTLLEVTALFVSYLMAKVHDRLILHERNLKTDDGPIQELEENLFPECEETARDILKRLDSGRRDGARGPNVALIGQYGSGKTSLCNLVKAIKREQDYKNDRALVFCRFEAWQYLTSDAAVRGLLDEIVGKIQDMVDCSGLGALPEEYIETLRSCPNGWFAMTAAILKRKRNPEEVVRAIQDVLLRIGKRLVLFVDDFDRLESKSKEAQEAIASALNQLQNLTTVQYVLCVGPMHIGPMHKGPGADLLKLTQFQELMPEMKGKTVIERMHDLRDEALRCKDEMYYPWDLQKEANDDPLLYYPHREGLPSTLVSRLVNLINTPRRLKAVEHETCEKWNGGLNGEICWYDLLLMSTLKVCEQKVFEWILREPKALMEEKIFIREPKEEERSEQRSMIEKKLNELVETKTKSRVELVQEILIDLFPSFMKGLGGWVQDMHRSDPKLWEQRISVEPIYGTSYFRRYISGRVPSTEVPDQAILQYIQKIKNNGFDKKEFELQYLVSYQKLTNQLNKFVQFSALLTEDIARDICDFMLDWMCDREHWDIWEQKYEFASSIISYISLILKRAGQFEFSVNRRKARQNQLETMGSEEWTKAQLERLVPKDAIVAIEFGSNVSKELLGESDTKILLGTYLKRLFIDQQDVFWRQAIENKYYLSWLLGVLKYNDDYEGIREQVTESCLQRAQSDQSEDTAVSLIRSLVHYSRPVGGPDLIDDYEFSVNKEDNRKTFNMEMVLPVLKCWEDRKFSDEFASKAFEHLMSAYSEEMKNLDSGSSPE